MKIFRRRPSARTSISLLAAAGLIAGAANFAPVLAGGHALLQLDSSSTAAVTTTLTGATDLYQGPDFSYPVQTQAAQPNTYTISCFSSSEVPPGTAGPYSISDMNTVWYLLDAPVPDLPGTLGYIQATSPLNQFSIASADVPNAVGRCASDPPPPPAGSNPPAIVAAPPQACPRGVLTGADVINVDASSGQLDIEFTAASFPESVSVTDETTGQSASGTALADQRATYHFKENPASSGTHTLSISTSDGFGGDDGGDGGSLGSDVAWEALSSDCTP